MKINKIIISPHFDDACLSAFSVLDKNSLVITLFSGIPKKKQKTYWDKLCGFKNSTEAITARSKENDLASKYIGFTAFNLNYVDWQYKQKNNIYHIERDIKNIINSYPDAKVFCPISFGGPIEHPDHIIATEIISQIWKEIKIKLLFYADLPYQEDQNLNWKTVKYKNKKQHACSLYVSQVKNLHKEFPNFNNLSILKEAYLTKRELGKIFPKLFLPTPNKTL